MLKKEADERNKKVTSKNFAPFTECISNIDNTQIYHARKNRYCDFNV